MNASLTLRSLMVVGLVMLVAKDANAQTNPCQLYDEANIATMRQELKGLKKGISFLEESRKEEYYPIVKYMELIIREAEAACASQSYQR